MKLEITPKSLKSACDELNYWFPNKNRPYDAFVFGVRNNNPDQSKDLFNDLIGIYYQDNFGNEKVETFKATTDPGRLELIDPSFPNAKQHGTAILVPRQHLTSYKLRFHGKGNWRHKALVQIKSVLVYRDKNRDEILDFEPDTATSGMYGINIHASSLWKELTEIGRYSAGCQVFGTAIGYTRFIFLVEKQVEHGLGNIFTYTLFNQEELERNI